MAGERQRLIKRLAHEQAAELLGPDPEHMRRVRSFEGERNAFRDFPVTGHRDVVQIEPVETTLPEVQAASLDQQA